MRRILLGVFCASLPLAGHAASHVGGSWDRGTPAPEMAPRARSSSEVAAADDDAADDATIEREVQAESADLEQARAAEVREHVAEPRRLPGDALRGRARLGLESPLRLRLQQAFQREGALPSEPAGSIPDLPEIARDLRGLQAEFDIPIEVNEAVVAYIRFFQKPPMRDHFVRWLARSYRYMPWYRRIMREEGLPEDTVFVAMIESGFSNLASSRARAVGPWQFIAETGRRMGLRLDFWVDERRDPEKAARAAAAYLRELYAQTGDWRLAWAGYNAGVGRVLRARARGYRDFWSMARAGVLGRETRGYVPKLMAAAIITKHPEAFGFARGELQRPLEYEVVEVPRATPLGVLAGAAEVSKQDLLDGNPELRRASSPPWPYALKVPKGKREAFARNWPRASRIARGLAFSQHRVAAGESLRAIAARYRTSPTLLARLNGLRARRHVRAGTELVVPGDAYTRAHILAYIPSEPPGSSREQRSRARPVGRRFEVAVRAGDTLWGISQRFGVDLDDLGSWNGIRDARRHKLLAGERLVVYPRARTAPGRRASVAVRPGDTLWEIAQRFGVRVAELCEWNGIRDARRFTLPVGSVLVVHPDPDR